MAHEVDRANAGTWNEQLDNRACTHLNHPIANGTSDRVAPLRTALRGPELWRVSGGVGQRTEESEDSLDLPIIIHFGHIEPGDHDLAVSADLPRVAVQTMVAIDPARARVLRARESRLHVVNICFELVKAVRLNAGIDEFDTGRQRRSRWLRTIEESGSFQAASM